MATGGWVERTREASGRTLSNVGGTRVESTLNAGCHARRDGRVEASAGDGTGGVVTADRRFRHVYQDGH